MKKCTKCGVEKELTEFQKSAKSKFGVKSVCKKCMNKPVLLVKDGHKICCNCKQEKLFEEFRFLYKHLNKRQGRCKECQNKPKIEIKEGYKKCSKCCMEKLLLEFSPHKLGKFKTKSRCRDCENEYSRVRGKAKTAKKEDLKIKIPEGFKKCIKCEIIKENIKMI